LQVIDLQQAISEYQQTDPATFGQAISTEGQGFAMDAIINDIQLPNSSGGMFTMFGLAADDFATSGGSGVAATQTLLAASGLTNVPGGLIAVPTGEKGVTGTFSGSRNHFIVGEKAILLGYGRSEASGCGQHDLPSPEPRGLPFPAVQESGT
jgi:hypothetical protein